MVQPTLANPGHTYAIYCTLPTSSSIPSDITTEIFSDGGVLSTNLTTAFGGSQNTWNLVCYLTNAPANPTITFTYSSYLMDGVTPQTAPSFSRRWYPAPLLFEDITDQCKLTPAIQVNAPLAAGQNYVAVSGVSTGATAIKIYADGVQVGAKTTGVTPGLNTVTTSLLVAGQEIKATQTTNNIEGCLPTSGPIVGSGSNPEIRIGFLLSQTNGNTGPIGALGVTSGNNYHIPATGTVNSGFFYPPTGSTVLYPNTCWQTISVQNGIDPSFTLNGAPTLPDANPFAALVGISFSCENLTDTGPFNIYIDNVMNGDVMIQDFESATNGQQGVFLQLPSAATIPTAFPVPGLDISEVTTDNANTGAKSLRFSWQFTTVSDIMWLRGLTGGTPVANPQVDLTKPLSMRVLVLPVGETTSKLSLPVAPQNQTGYLGKTASFTVTASGTPPYTYQWFKDGVEIPGANTSSFELSNLTLNDAGAYSVSVMDANCTIVSPPGILTVSEQPPPPGRIEIQWASPNVILSWEGDYVLQESSVVTGTYTDIAGAVSPYTYNAVQTRFFRLRTP